MTTNTTDTADRTEHGSDLARLHSILRAILVEKATGSKMATSYGADIGERLRIKSEEMRMEGLADWWLARETKAKVLDQLEEYLVRAFSKAAAYGTLILNQKSQKVWDAAVADLVWPKEVADASSARS